MRHSIAISHMSPTSAHLLAWLVIIGVLIGAARGLLWLLGWR